LPTSYTTSWDLTSEPANPHGETVCARSTPFLFWAPISARLPVLLTGNPSIKGTAAWKVSAHQPATVIEALEPGWLPKQARRELGI
jgi:hypothetical protein